MVTLTESDQAMLAGEAGPGVAMAMRIVVGLARATGAAELVDITRAHIDGCLYHGPAGLEYARALAEGGASVAVPTTLNVSSLDLLHPNLYRGPAEEAAAARSLMDAYVAMGCTPTWTCAPYQLTERPAFGEQIAWAESNAIVFANSVLGARTDRYGDFIDIAAAITGRAPLAGFHLDEARRAGMLVDVRGIAGRHADGDVFFALLGHILGRDCGRAVPAVIGIERASEDQLKAMAAAGASSGAIGLFHIVGITPEAPDLTTVTGGRDLPVLTITEETLAGARRELTSAAAGGPLSVVSVGTPHYSVHQIARFADLLDGRSVHPRVTTYLNTNRAALEEAGDLVGRLEAAGVRFVVDTCTYVTQIMGDVRGVALTDSAKWAYYAPGNVDVDVVFGDVIDCVESAVAGELVIG